jgi:hypothetical protein
MKPAMLALAVAMIALTTSAIAQDRRQCSAKCGGRPAGEANTPSVTLCISKCMGATGASDSVGKRTFK